MSSNGSSSVTRRSWLKKFGIASAGIAALPKVSAEENVVRKFRKGLRHRQYYDWSLERWLEYVENLGINYGNDQMNRSSTQVIAGFEPSDLTLTMTYYMLSAHPPYPGYDQIELHWKFDDSGVDDQYTGEPKDLAKIGYKPGEFSKPNQLDGESWYEYGPDTSSAGIDSVSDGGIIGEWNGLYLDTSGLPWTDGEIGGDAGLEDYMSVYVNPADGKSYEDLTIHFGYSMLYDSAKFAGPSFTSDGVIGYGIKNDEDSWTVNPSFEAADIVDGKEYTP